LPHSASAARVCIAVFTTRVARHHRGGTHACASPLRIAPQTRGITGMNIGFRAHRAAHKWFQRQVTWQVRGSCMATWVCMAWDSKRLPATFTHLCARICAPQTIGKACGSTWTDSVVKDSSSGSGDSA